MTPKDPLVTAEIVASAQVAEALETSEDSVLYLKQECGLPHVYVNRAQWRVPWKALDEWLTTQAGQAAMNGLANDKAHA